jgi:hypothetical protein
MRLLLDEHPVRLPEIAVIQKATHHVLRNLACVLLVELVPWNEFKIAIGTSQRSLETSGEQPVGLHHDHASSAAIGMAVCQPEEGRRVSRRRRFGLLGHAARIDRKVKYLQSARWPVTPALFSLANARQPRFGFIL